MEALGGIFQSAAAAGPFGLVLLILYLMFKARLSGDPALWKRIETLEQRLDEQREHFEKKLEEERKECAAQLAKLEAEVRQLQQIDSSRGHLADTPDGGALRRAFPPPRPRAGKRDQDQDLLNKLK